MEDEFLRYGVITLGGIQAVLLTLPMKYYSYRQRSTTPIANEVLLLSPMKYYSDFNRFRFTPFLLFYETASPSFYSLTD